MLDLFDEVLTNALGEIRNWVRWSDIVAAILTDLISCDVMLQNMLSMRVLERPVSRVGWSI